ncbi:MAG: hypothetical protein FJX72_04825 [Armatimonadetes bacterium]|nr:hypothetical protein [Armatimonadota bacterium]
MGKSVADRLALSAVGVSLALLCSVTVAQERRQGGPREQGRFQGPGGQMQAPGFPGMFQPGQMFQPGHMMQPELAAKTAQIMALREIHSARFTAKDIGVALESLKQMREAEKALQTKSEQVLEGEKRALLAAGPDDDAPRGTGEAMREAAEAHRAKLERLWAKLGDNLNERKVGSLRRLLGEMFGPPGMMPGRMQGMPGMGPGPGGPGGPGMGPGGPGGPDRRGGGEPPNDSDEDGSFFGEAPQPEGQVGAPPPGQGRPGGRAAGQGGVRRPNAPAGGPGFQGPGMGGPMGMPPMMGMGPRLSLADLVELLEAKLAAMRK